MATTVDRSKTLTTIGGQVDSFHLPGLAPWREHVGSPYPLDDDDDTADRIVVAETLSKRIFFDGVFKGSYSLAIVNRCLATALIEAGIDLVCHTPEADWQTDAALATAPKVKAFMRDSYPEKGSVDVHLRNTWPPKTGDMVGRINAYVCFAWEESELPPYLVERFNRDLDLVMVTSNFVRDAFLHSGVTIPVAVVGNGCDHVLAIEPADSVPSRSPGVARILHVSSGFPRKGPDTLIAAYLRTFRRDDPVELVLKTFANPDNIIAATLERLATPAADRPPIKVIQADYSYEELIALYKTATMIVAPSRGEGFGLPLAEAMLLGIPVVTTNYSGQIDFCRPDTAWMVDYKIAPSHAHVTSAFSTWADASVEHLGEQMTAVLRQPGEARLRGDNAKRLLEAHFTWGSVATRVVRALAKAARPGRACVGSPAWTMDLVTAWRQRCGIATYAEHLYGTPALAPRVTGILGRRVLDDALPPGGAGAGDPRLSRVWGFDLAALMQLARRLEGGRADVMWMQHHPGHFSNPDMEILANALRDSAYRVRAITFHNVREADRAGSLRWTHAFDLAFVHSAEDAAILSATGHRNPIVVPHGFVVGDSERPNPDPAHFTIGSFGFLNPHKNVDKLVIAFAQARRFEPRLRLKILNSVQQHDASRLGRAVVENLIAHFDLGDSVSARFDFLPEDEMVRELSTCDLLAFPYGASNETATGAARIGMSVDRPLLCSRSSVLRDLWSVSHVLKSDDIDCLTEALVSLAQNRHLLGLYDRERRRTTEWYSYPRVAERCAVHIARALSEPHERSKAA